MSKRKCVVSCVPVSVYLSNDTILVSADGAEDSATLSLPMSSVLQIGDSAAPSLISLDGVVRRCAAEVLPGDEAAALADKIIREAALAIVIGARQ